MSVVLVYDDTVEVPTDVAAAIGINRFGELLYKRVALADRVVGYADAAKVGRVVHLKIASDVRDAAEQSRKWAGPVVYLPACLAPRDPDGFVALLRRARHGDAAGVLTPDGSAAGLGVMCPRRFRSYAAAGLHRGSPAYLADRAGQLGTLPNQPRLADLSDYRTFLDYMTGQFQARFFNQMAFNDATVEKRSTDKVKMRREYEFYGHLPEAMQPYFVRPFGYREGADEASYQLERLFVPDVAVQWTHDAMTVDEFRTFLDVVFRFLAVRDRRPATAGQVAAAGRKLYLDKLDGRMALLRESPVYDALDDMVRRGTAWDGLGELTAAYRGLFARHGRPPAHNYLCVGHGDLCFSNILYDKRLRLLRLIDPRGADTADALYTDPYYDVAKLSHSILGGYDYLNQNLFGVDVDEDLRLRLRPAARDQQAKKAAFRAKLAEYEFDPHVVRLYEASLFLSMLPLHLENQRKLLGFVLTAADICGELAAADAGADLGGVAQPAAAAQWAA